MKILLLLIVIAAIFWSIQAKIQFKYLNTLISRIKWLEWWTNPKISYQNKYKFKNPVLKLLFSTVLVFTTDLYHFSQFITKTTLILAICYREYMCTNEFPWLGFISLLIIWGIIFEINWKFSFFKG